MTSRQTTGEADKLVQRYMAQLLILWTSPTWSKRDKLIATFVSPAGLVALFIGLVAAMGGRRLTLPLAVAILLAVAGLTAHLLPAIHLMRTRRQRLSAFTRSTR